jgi:proteasome lid subunit RPN8/RPN11
MDRLCLTREVYDGIAATVGSMKAEQGAALGWLEGDRVVRFFRFDDTARTTGATYSPDDGSLNVMFREDWNPRGIRLAGFVHSHPRGCAWPSAGDLAYAQRILAAISDLPYLLLPIVQTVPDTGTFELVPFLAFRDGDTVAIRHIGLEILDGEEPGAVAAADTASSASAPAASTAGPTGDSDAREALVPGAAFNRVVNAYDLTRMARSRVVAVGTGGAAGFLEDLGRCGVGELVLIDPDMVTMSNIATQQVYRKDLGRPKVIALAERLDDINPRARIKAVTASLGDLDDKTMRDLCLGPIGGGPAPAVSLLCGLTDSFHAQARVNALVLNLGLPSLCAQVYREGRGAEITFTYPGLTPACHRCILASRYRAYLAEGYHNQVTSHGTPIFATARLNAAKGFIALALLHHRPGPAPAAAANRFADLAARISNRNLVQIRMDPDLSDVLQIRTFDRVFGGSDQESLLFDETVWRPQEPKSGGDGAKPCPDCGGTGDLRDAMGTFTDTREIRPEGS